MKKVTSIIFRSSSITMWASDGYLQYYNDTENRQLVGFRFDVRSSQGFEINDYNDIPDACVYYYDDLEGVYHVYNLYVVESNGYVSSGNENYNRRARGLKIDLLDFPGFELNTFFELLSSFSIQVPSTFFINRVTNYSVVFQTFIDYYLSDFYPAIVDNSNQFQLLNSLSQSAGTHLTDDDYKDIMAIETYNRNYLLAHLQPNVTGNLEVTGDINASTSGSGSGGGSSTDVSGIVTQLQNISNKLTYIHNNNDSVNLAELLYYVAEALEYGLTFDDEQQVKHSFLDELNKKLEYTQMIDDESVTKNITETINDTKDTIANKDMTVINNLDYSDRISSKPKISGYPDDDLLI